MKHILTKIKTIRVGTNTAFLSFLLISVFALAGTVKAEPRQCICHVPPKVPFEVCSAGFDEGHLNHGDPQGMCNSCGNGIRECCIIEVVGEGADAIEVSTECCSFEENPPDGVPSCNDATEAFLAECREEECDDGDNDCTTNNCDANCRISNCDDGNECTNDACDNDPKSNDFGACLNEPSNDGEECDIGSACKSNAMCLDGECVGEDRNCDDMDFCTLDLCDEKAADCVHIDFDEDGDGVADCVDNCPPPQFIMELPEDEIEGYLELFGVDSVEELLDIVGAGSTKNADQADGDMNGLGDVCDELVVIAGDGPSNACSGSLTGFHQERISTSVAVMPYLLLGLGLLISGLGRLRFQSASKRK